jgi:diadenosine tetraphosphate (Ap4A) HIT family hydrolase
VLRDGWRVAHAFNTSLPGWLVLVPLRHIERFGELTEHEAAALGPLALGCARALQLEVACEKTYLVQLGETQGFEHVHVHVIPRMAQFDDDTKGPGVFALLDRNEEEWIPESERDELAMRLRRRLERVL